MLALTALWYLLALYCSQIIENAEINNIIKIIGLQYNKKYNTEDDLKSLRYGHMMIMTDQDQDGSHIKGLVINFIHSNWPGLLKLGFVEQFITPIVKVGMHWDCANTWRLCQKCQCLFSIAEFYHCSLFKIAFITGNFSVFASVFFHQKRVNK